jgi:hypothetical protein
MTRVRRIMSVVVIAAVGAVGWISYEFLHTLAHIPEAYAAWDTGTLLIEYMKQHDDRWPKSWDDLLTVLDDDEGSKIPLRGAQAGDGAYAASLRELVAVDWDFEPANPNVRSPVAPISGGKFSTLWEGAEPNEMVRSYLSKQTSMQPSATR